jgi:D-alanine-D-alanine ligase
VPPDAGQDELDVLDEAAAVSEALAELGHEAIDATFSLNLEAASVGLRALRPDFVFNLVESVEGSGRLVYLAPALLDFLKIRYSGCPTEAIFVTGNKLLTKRMLHGAGIPTPPWLTLHTPEHAPSQGGRWIIKSVWEHASVGLNEDSVIADPSTLPDRLHRAGASAAGDSFAELYIHGREFNVSVLAGPRGPEVLPVAEMVFVGFPEGRPRIVDYRAKWDEESFEYKNTVRSFDLPSNDAALVEQLRELSRQCWTLFQLRGYARVDFRVDESGRPWVLEVNTNPCISKQAGFLTAAGKAGLSPADAVARIMADSRLP